MEELSVASMVDTEYVCKANFRGPRSEFGHGAIQLDYQGFQNGDTHILAPNFFLG